jgi:hypothetical protein
MLTGWTFIPIFNTVLDETPDFFAATEPFLQALRLRVTKHAGDFKTTPE